MMMKNNQKVIEMLRKSKYKKFHLNLMSLKKLEKVPGALLNKL